MLLALRDLAVTLPIAAIAGALRRNREGDDSPEMIISAEAVPA